MQLNSLDDVLREQLEDLYDAEQQLVAALPGMASAASSEELRKAFDHHLEETRGHVTRLQEIFGQKYPVLASFGLAIGSAGRAWGVDALLARRNPASLWW